MNNLIDAQAKRLKPLARLCSVNAKDADSMLHSPGLVGDE